MKGVRALIGFRSATIGIGIMPLVGFMPMVFGMCSLPGALCTVPSVAEDLGVSRSMIYRWKREMDKDQQTCFPGNGQVNLTDQELELKRLQNGLNEVRMERDILKKAISIFSKTDRKYSSS